MIIRLSFILFSVFSLIHSTSAQIISPQVEATLDLVRKEYDGEKALATTAFVSEKWRVPGNSGFNASIYEVQKILEAAGYEAYDSTKNQALSYRLEKYPLRRPTWEPVAAQVFISGQDQPILDFKTNRNMIAINSFPTPESGFVGEVVYLKECTEKAIENLDLKGKIVMADCHPYPLYKLAVEKGGAAGILCYRIPGYNQPEKYPNSIPFRSIPFNSNYKAWAVCLSYAAKSALVNAMKDGPLKLKVNIDTKIYPSEELTLIAEIKGKTRPDDRFVFSAHVQEPGANDNASGVGAQAEMARVAAKLFNDKKINPDRTITFLWGDEISSTRRYIQQDSLRALGILWGMSLDMVGEDTDKTGGTFLIEKMPDPSAIWTRGEDKHTEWGATPVKEKDFNPHYFNDYITYVCRRQAVHANWTINTNPFEGGSDHQPFLDAKIPGLLLWHFTDVFYHTDADRIDKVSPKTLANVGISALSSALVLCNGSEATAQSILEITSNAAQKRIEAENALSADLLKSGGAKKEEEKILRAWQKWYDAALKRVTDVLLTNPSSKLEKQIAKAVKKTKKMTNTAIKKWK